jgi:hypothetical protein
MLRFSCISLSQLPKRKLQPRPMVCRLETVLSNSVRDHHPGWTSQKGCGYGFLNHCFAHASSPQMMMTATTSRPTSDRTSSLPSQARILSLLASQSYSSPASDFPYPPTMLASQSVIKLMFCSQCWYAVTVRFDGPLSWHLTFQQTSRPRSACITRRVQGQRGLIPSLPLHHCLLLVLLLRTPSGQCCGCRVWTHFVQVWWLDGQRGRGANVEICGTRSIPSARQLYPPGKLHAECPGQRVMPARHYSQGRGRHALHNSVQVLLESSRPR